MVTDFSDVKELLLLHHICVATNVQHRFGTIKSFRINLQTIVLESPEWASFLASFGANAHFLSFVSKLKNMIT